MSSLVGKYGRRIGLRLLLLLVGGISFDRAWRGRYDFHHFYLDARYVWEHGQLNPDLDNPEPLKQRQLPFYLPIVSLALAPLTCAGLPLAAALWAAGQAACLGFALMVLLGWCRTDRRVRTRALVLASACVLALPAILEAAKFNQLTILVLALLLGAFGVLERDRPLRAGALFGLAAMVKLLPAIFIGWLLLKRRWKALGAFVATVAVVAVLPCLAVFGPQKTLQYHHEWWQHNVYGAPAGGMADGSLTDHFIDRRNQGLTVVCARLFSPQHPYHVSFQPLRLDAGSCVLLARGILVVLLAGLIWRTIRPWHHLGHLQRRVEFATCLLAMMVFSPLVRQYYLVWALPALLLLLCLVANDSAGQRRKIGWAAIAVWLVGMLLWTWEAARICGAHWLMLTVMGVLLLAATSGPPARHPLQNRHAVQSL